MYLEIRHVTTAFTFSIKIGIWEMPGYLGNFPNAWVSEKFPKFLQEFQGGIFIRCWNFLKWLDI